MPATGRAERRVRRALADQIALTRAVYRRRRPGHRPAGPGARPCVATAAALYARILDRIEAHGHNVFAGRVTVGGRQRLALAGAALTRVAWTRATGR